MVAAAGAPVLAVLTRAPSVGGKSRLFTGLRRPPDPALLTALLLDTLEGAAAPGVVRAVAVEPAAACAEVRALVPAGVEVIAQDEGHLGRRMQRLMARLFARGAAAVVLIGSDLPELTPGHVTAALAGLRRDPRALVLGPAADGGYYLIGAARTPDVFDGIDWGTGRVLAQTRARAEAVGLPVHLLDPLADVDTPADLRRLIQTAEARGAAPRTRRWAIAHARR